MLDRLREDVLGEGACVTTPFGRRRVTYADHIASGRPLGGIVAERELLLDTGKAAMDCREDVHDAYNERIDAGNREMAWGAPNVTSWYKNSKGRVTQNWPFTLLEFWEQTKSPEPGDYRLS